MNNQKIQRGVLQKWNAPIAKNSPIHKARFIMPSGNWEVFDPFLLMAEDEMKKGAFDSHPHRGIETVTYLIDGTLNHRDNRGNKGALSKGDTQWMSAGKGIIHLEEAPADGFAKLLQLWVNLPAADKMSEPTYQDILEKDTLTRTIAGGKIRVISGTSGDITAGTKNHVPVKMIEVELMAGYSHLEDIVADFNGFIYILDGKGKFGKDHVEAEQNEIVWLEYTGDVESQIYIEADTNLKLLFVAGKPLREPVVAGGPFVMNTEAEIEQAYRDFRSGKFGKWEED